MAIRGCLAWALLAFILVLTGSTIEAVTSEENSFVVHRHVGDATVGLVGRGGNNPCHASENEMRREGGYLRQKVDADGAMTKGPCLRQTTTQSCPVKCFRADPVCGTDKITYWCGVADALCAGVEVAHDGYCSLWESNTNIGSSTAVQSLQLVHMLWLVVSGIVVVLGLL